MEEIIRKFKNSMRDFSCNCVKSYYNVFSMLYFQSRGKEKNFRTSKTKIGKLKEVYLTDFIDIFFACNENTRQKKIV